MIVYLLGTKAQYIKMAPVLLESRRQGLPHSLILTGQHRETFDELEANFGLSRPDAVLVTGDEAATRTSFLAWLLRAWRAPSKNPEVERLLRSARALVVHGDTASTLLGALIARRRSIPVVHVEAGLRSFDLMHPFPEEIIRRLVGRLTALHLCPDATAAKNLEGVRGEKLVTAGNTLIDAQRLALADGRGDASAVEGPFAVFSMHRHENLFDRGRLAQALDILRRVAERVPVRFVLHPVTRRRLSDLGRLDEIGRLPGVTLVDRMDFFSFSRLIRRASLVLTDGGSNQEECAMLGIPCVLLRRATERNDGLERGVLLADLDAARIDAFVQQALAGGASPHAPAAGESPTRIIVDALRARFLAA